MGSVTVVSRPRVDRGSGFWTSGFRLWGLGFRGLGFGVLGVGFVCRDNLLCFLHVEALGVEEQLEIHFPRLFTRSRVLGRQNVGMVVWVLVKEHNLSYHHRDLY